MGKITEALKKVSDERLARIQKRPEIQYIVKKVKNTSIDQHIVSFHDPNSPIDEQYKILRTNIQSLKHAKNYKSFIITSSIDGEGKTITALNLAVTTAHDLSDKSILLIDADMRKGKVARYLGVTPRAGLSELLQEKAEADDVFISPGIANLTVVLAGKRPKNPSALLNSKKLEQFIAMLKTRFDYIFIDTPPVMPLTDACIIGPMVDGAIFVIQAGKTQRDIVKHAETRLYQARAKTVGYVITNIEYHLPNYLYRYINRYDNYHYYSNKTSENKEEVLT
ncbi:CpsD/CapB family tyrosine-protein kinase [Omnitrophica bacterium]|nr:CpsD/CapB family tyrosine-protein kinase [Candidatus Omnitrophota bacterium]